MLGSTPALKPESSAAYTAVTIGSSLRSGWPGSKATSISTSMRASATAASFNTSITASADVNWLASVRGRVGYLWTPGLLLYGTAGAAWADIDYQANLQSPGFIAGVNHTTTKDGFVVGAGAEYMWSRQWLVRAEYLFYDFSGSTRSFALVPATLHWDNLGISVVRLGASYKF